MPELSERGTARKSQSASEHVIDVDFDDPGVGLTPDGQVAVEGFVRYYLATWYVRAAEGTAPRSRTWPDLVYQYAPTRLTMPVLRSEAKYVLKNLRSIINRHRPGRIRSAPCPIR